MRCYKTELNPNEGQKKRFVQDCGLGRYAYNWALDVCKKVYSEGKKRPSAIDLHKLFVQLKHSNPEMSWVKDQSKCVPQQSFRNLDRAYGNFFKNLAKKKKSKGKSIKAGFPKPKSRKNGLGTAYYQGTIRIQMERLKFLQSVMLN